MLSSADFALKQLDTIIKEFTAFLENKGKASEADTRVKLVDRILKEVCKWPETQLSREDKVESGYTDYQLKVRDMQLIAVEAKREGLAFTLPASTSILLKLNGALATDPQVRDAINQVRQYCDDGGIRYAITTNGYAWILFKAIRDDIPWRIGTAHIFPSIEYIREHFVNFWNLLSYEAISEGSLEDEFSPGLTTQRKLLRVIDKIFNADLPLTRNRLSTQLRPIITYIFEDITAQHDLDLLQKCYVHTKSVQNTAEGLKYVISDAIPRRLINEGAYAIDDSEDGSGEFGAQIRTAIANKRGELYLLLGGIGCGKTTFLRRYQRTIEKNFLDRNAYTFHLDFLMAPVDAKELESFVWKEVLESIRRDYSTDNIENRRYLKSIFRDKIANLERTVLRKFKRRTEEYEDVVGDYLLRWQDDLADYVPKLLKFGSVVHNKTVVLFIDNVDQLAPMYQAQIFLLAQRITRLAACVTVIALREESYYTPSIQTTFSAFSSHKFHIASPQFRPMIVNRINYATHALEGSNQQLRNTVLRGHSFDTRDICEFLRIVQISIFKWSRRISTLIECLCFGNMRSALQMFTTFLQSGATDVDKMLIIYRRDGSYFVAFHEFLKAVMLQDRSYYKEDQSPIFNIFNCTNEKNSSHFTSLRILAILLEHRSESSPEGRGYVELSRLLSIFLKAFDNLKDITNTLDRLVQRQLTEVNTRSTIGVAGASHIRVTAAGWYYLNVLSKQFAYLDLVLQDTPLNDAGLEHHLRHSVYNVNNLADRDYEKITRMQVRFDRTQEFLNYLQKEEDSEYDAYSLKHIDNFLRFKFMIKIQSAFQQERGYIEQRLSGGRTVDAPDQATENIAPQFDILIDEPVNSTES